MADSNYPIAENPVYNPEIRALQDSDPARASTVFNPLFSQLIDNTHAVKKEVENKVEMVEGKGLSSNDFTDLLKTQYDGYETGKEDAFTKNDAFNKSYGTTAGTTAQGNDGRFTDARPNPHALTFTGAVTGSYDGSSAKTIEIPSGGATSIYDQVIRTQAEFDVLIASPTWLDAKSVCFIGDGGTLKFTRATTGYKIPQTVKNIKGLHSAILEVTDFAFNHATSKAVLFYALMPTTDDYSIDSIECIVTSTVTGQSHGFSYCTQLTNCTGTGNEYGFSHCTQLTNCTGTDNVDGNGFGYCTQLTNCTGAGAILAFGSCKQLTNCIGTGNGKGFSSCTQLTNCTGTGATYGFSYCTQVTNCTGANNVDGSGFSSCTQLTNCTGTGKGSGYESGNGFYHCTQLTNCTGTGRDGYGLYNCKYINGCKPSDTPSAKGFLGGTNTKVDTLTVG